MSAIVNAFILVLLFGCSGNTPRPPAPDVHIEIKSIPQSLEEFVLIKLKTNQLDNAWLRLELARLLKDPKKSYQKIISLNVLGFLSKANYSLHYSEKGLRKAKAFLKENSKTLSISEKKLGVSKESIAGLLWVETQYGRTTGQYPLAQVYLSLLLCDHPEILRNLIDDASRKRNIDPLLRQRFPETLTFEQKILDRTKAKSEWAKEQLLVLADLKRLGYLKVVSIKGSYAGAFGFPQFLPSTYRDFALSANNSKRANLYKMPDAILSVANYLKAKGWDENKPESKITALYEYNRISDYGAIILKIAEALKNVSKS